MVNINPMFPVLLLFPGPTILFITQGCDFSGTILYQDSLDAILLENNGRESNSKRTTHFDCRLCSYVPISILFLFICRSHKHGDFYIPAFHQRLEVHWYDPRLSGPKPSHGIIICETDYAIVLQAQRRSTTTQAVLLLFLFLNICSTSLLNHNPSFHKSIHCYATSCSRVESILQIPTSHHELTRSMKTDEDTSHRRSVLEIVLFLNLLLLDVHYLHWSSRNYSRMINIFNLHETSDVTSKLREPILFLFTYICTCFSQHCTQFYKILHCFLFSHKHDHLSTSHAHLSKYINSY